VHSFYRKAKRIMWSCIGKSIWGVDNVSFCGLLYDAFGITDYIVCNGRMIDELERIWKEVVMA
jgi:hypothetical protein